MGDRKTSGQLRRLGVAIPSSAAVVTLLAFGVVGAAVVLDADRTASRRAEQTSRQLSGFVRERLEHVMQAGASRDTIVRSARQALGDDGTDHVRLHPRDRIAATAPDRPSSRLAWVVATGREDTARVGDVLRSYFPVVAGDSCTTCHEGARAGDMLAVLEIDHDLGPELDARRNGVLLLLFALLPAPILLAFVASRRLTRQLSRSVAAVRDCTRKVARGDELEACDLDAADVRYAELDEVFREVKGLAEALQETRDLRFQVTALDAMTISAEAVRNWSNEVARVVATLRRELPLRALVAGFARPGGGVEVVIFWNGPAADVDRAALAAITIEKWEGAGAGPASGDFTHVEVPGPGVETGVVPELASCAATFLGLRVPQVGGVTTVGLALSAGFVVRPLALRGVLATLLNTVGALRAIDGYTRQVEYFATRDALTALPNRRMFDELLGYEVERARRHDYSFAVLVLDLDGFKQVNDTYGHAFGDTFLAAVATALRAVARTEDVLARYGGDEFVLIASGADAARARLVATRLLDSLAGFTLAAPDGTVLRAGASVGAAIYPQHGATADEIFRRADAEMYRAKAAGKGCLRLADEA